MQAFYNKIVEITQAPTNEKVILEKHTSEIASAIITGATANIQTAAEHGHSNAVIALFKTSYCHIGAIRLVDFFDLPPDTRLKYSEFDLATVTERLESNFSPFRLSTGILNPDSPDSSRVFFVRLSWG
jgi:hypothetical protein